MTSESERGLGTVLLCLVPSGVNLHNAFAPGVYLQVVGSGYFTQPVFVPSTGTGGNGGSNQSNLVPVAPGTTLVASPGQQPHVLLQPVPQNQFNGNGNQQYIYSQPSWIVTPLSVEQPQYQRMSGNDSPVSLNPNAQTFYPSYYTKHLADFKGGYAADGSGMVIYNVPCTYILPRMEKSEEVKDGSQWCPAVIPVFIKDAGIQSRKSNAAAEFEDNKEASCNRLFKEPKSSYLSLAPTTLRFPYNDNRRHSQPLTIWNRTLGSLKIRLRSPDPEIFLIHIEGKRPGPVHQLLLYGYTAKTISIKCNPGRYKMAKSTLHLLVYTCRDQCECLELPLEIYPSTKWFNLPKTIVMPDVTVGRRAHAIITLPHPQHAEKFFVTFQPSYIPQQPVTLSPMNGSIGGKEGIRQIKITYSPTEFTTVNCIIKVHFPGLSPSAFHEIQIVGRCKPGREAEDIRKEIKEIETFRPKPKKKKRWPRMKFKGVLTSRSLETLDRSNAISIENQNSSLFTLAGVMHFFLRKPQREIIQVQQTQTPLSINGVEVLAAHTDLEHEEKLHIYNTIKKKFGFDFEEGSEHHEHRKRLKTYQRKDWEELQRLVGIPLFGKAEELPKDLEESEQPRSSFTRHGGDDIHRGQKRSNKKTRTSAGSNISGHSSGKAQKSISEEERQLYRSINEEVPDDFTLKEKFIQAARLIMTRWRADRRIVKLRVLIEETRRSRAKKSLVKQRTSSSTKRSMHANNVETDEKDASTRPPTNHHRKSIHPQGGGDASTRGTQELDSGVPKEKQRVEKKTRFSKRYVKDEGGNSETSKLSEEK